jgi:exodeoxyribonuclease V beta subunit
MEAITRKDTKSWFDPGPSAGVFTEKEVVNKQGQTKRIDRLVVTRDEAVIIDYKTGGLKDIDKHKKQVKEYMDIISDIYPAKQVKGYLLYIDHKMLEEVG